MYTKAMKKERYTLEELSAETGIEPRTIRSYIQQGLVRGPEARGRNAYYVDHHARRLRAIKLLKDFYGLQLKEIRRLLLSHGDADIDVEQLVQGKHGGEDEAPAASALDYIRAVKALGPGDTRSPEPRIRSAPHPPASSSAPGGQGGGSSALPPLLKALEEGLGGAPMVRRSRGEPWVHIPITPDVYLAVRQDLGVAELARFEQLADYIREYLTGGGSHESDESTED